MPALPTRIHSCSRCAALLRLLPALSCCHSVLDASNVSQSTSPWACSHHIRSCNYYRMPFQGKFPGCPTLNAEACFRLLPMLLCRPLHKAQPTGASAALAWHMRNVLSMQHKGKSICTAVPSHVSATGSHDIAYIQVPLKSCMSESTVCVHGLTPVPGTDVWEHAYHKH